MRFQSYVWFLGMLLVQGCGSGQGTKSTRDKSVRTSNEIQTGSEKDSLAVVGNIPFKAIRGAGKVAGEATDKASEVVRLAGKLDTVDTPPAKGIGIPSADGLPSLSNPPTQASAQLPTKPGTFDPRQMFTPIAVPAPKPKAPNVPEAAFPQQGPIPEGATQIARLERISPDAVTGSFQPTGEVKDAIVEKKIKEIEGILAHAGEGQPTLPPIKVIPDPNSPGGYALFDSNHTLQAYKALGFDKIPARIYDLPGADDFLNRSKAYNPERYRPINEIKRVDEFSPL